MGSTELTFSNWHRVFCSLSWQTIFNLATINFRSSCNSVKNVHSFFFMGGGGAGAMGCNKSKPHFLSITVHADASTMISLWERNGSPRIIGEHKPGATIARAVFE